MAYLCRGLPILCALAFVACGDDDGAVDASRPDTSVVNDAGEDGEPVDAGMDVGGETCDGLDNDRDGFVDEDCPCEAGAMQECFPRPALIAGCMQGAQECVTTAAGTAWSVCDGALLPLEGQTTCCSALGDDPTFTALDRFIDGVPAETFPQTAPAVNTFLPVVGDLRMTTAVVSVANEFVDLGRGGVTAANIAAGRAEVRRVALADLGIEDINILHTSEPDPVFEGSGCSGWGHAWGSMLYRTAEDGVEEVVYLYAGVCNDGDAEGFYRTEVSLEVCEAGTAPLM